MRNLILFFLISLLAACGGNADATAASNSPASAQATVAPSLAPSSSPTPRSGGALPSSPRVATATPGAANPTTAPSGDDGVILAAGDIGLCGSSNPSATATLLASQPGTILALGDEAYPSGAPSDFAKCYDPSWGKLKARTHPVPGNHEYATAGVAGYFGYFGASAGPAGKAYYSFDIGSWHVIALNSEIGVNAGSAQEQWLRADLAAHPNTCTLAYWHQPRFSSGPHGTNDKYQPLWQALYDGGADIVLNGHDHDYERFAPQAPDGKPDPARGIREFVVGTGGAGLYPFVLIASNSEFRNDSTWGVLKLTLHSSSYDWQYLTTGDETVKDSGSGTCH